MKQIPVHIWHTPDETLMAPLKALVHESVIVTVGEDIPSPAEYRVLVSGVPDERQITASQFLHTLIIPWSGLPAQTRALMLDYPNITVHNIHHNAGPVAEMAVTLMLAAAKGLVPIDGALRRQDWAPRYLTATMPLLEGKTVVILGYGAIGRRIGAICEGLGMRIIGLNRTPVTRTDTDVALKTIDSLDEVLRQAEVLFVCVPRTDDTTGLLGERELALLRPGSILVNIARGPVIDEQALYVALRERRIRAGLDVWYAYPQSEDSRCDTSPSAYPFHELDNVVMTPHLAGHSIETEALRARELARLLNLAAEGKPLPNRVDLERGY